MERVDWLKTVIKEFSRKATAVAGLKANAANLRSDGCGIGVSDPQSQGFDFVDGSFMAVNGTIARRLGLFNRSYEFFYFEDADLCLRYRQAGYGPKLMNLECHHDRYSSTRLLPRYLVEGVLDYNRSLFFGAWSAFLERRVLGPRILICFETQDCIQQCASLPALFGILDDHPSATLEITGVHPILKKLFQHERFVLRPSREDCETTGYFRVCCLARIDSPSIPLTEAIGRELQSVCNVAAVRKHLAALSFGRPNSGPRPATLLVVARDTPYFQGLRPTVDSINRILVARQHVGATAIYTELPKYERPTEWDGAHTLDPESILPLVNDLQSLPLVVSTDHWVLQLAQLIGAPCFAWFGAISVRSRIWNWASCGAFTVPDLACLGCAHALGHVAENVCIRGDVICVDGRSESAFLAQLEEFATQRKQMPWLDAAWKTPAFANRRKPSQDLDLSKWPPTIVENVLVLIAVNPSVSKSQRERCLALATRATKEIRRSRVVLDDRGEAPARGAHPYRQAALASIRQGMLKRHLGDEQWVFWVDADIVDYSEDLLIQLIRRADGGIAAPMVIMEGDPGEPVSNSHGFGPGRFFDVAGFVESGRWASFTRPYFSQTGPIFDLESVGSCYVANAEIFRQGGRFEADDLSKKLVSSGAIWPDDAVRISQTVAGLAFTEHYSVCTFARNQGLPVRAFADLLAYHERV